MFTLYRFLSRKQSDCFFSLWNQFLSFTVHGDFLIDGPNCKIPNMNPFAKEAMKVFKREKFEPCSPKWPLTSVAQNLENDTVQVIIHEDRKKDFLTWWQADLKVCNID